jgi:non-canonical (house-cleaning) NTP pyrophosphatase
MLMVVGSTRPAKVGAARDAIDAIARVDERFRQAVVQPIDVTDVAPTMPMTDLAILDGAHLRAQTLIDRTAPTADARLAIGVEGGLDPLPSHPGRYLLKTWAAVTDGTRWGYGGGGAILLPDHVTRQVRRSAGHAGPGACSPAIWWAARTRSGPQSSRLSRRFTIPLSTNPEVSALLCRGSPDAAVTEVHVVLRIERNPGNRSTCSNLLGRVPPMRWLAIASHGHVRSDAQRELASQRVHHDAPAVCDVHQALDVLGRASGLDMQFHVGKAGGRGLDRSDHRRSDV